MPESGPGCRKKQLAFRAGIERTYVSHLENDKKSPTVQMLFRICQALDVSPSTLIARLERRVIGKKKATKVGMRKHRSA